MIFISQFLSSKYLFFVCQSLQMRHHNNDMTLKVLECTSQKKPYFRARKEIFHQSIENKIL